MDKLVRFRIFNQYKEVSHCFTTRKGGISDGVFSTLNMGFNRGDENEHVMENIRRVALELGLSPKQLVLSDQVHDNRIYKVTKKDLGKGITRESDIIGIDGLITNEPGIGLMTFYADCVPLYFYDPVSRSIGISHAGWKGTVKKIGVQTIKALEDNYGARRKNIIVGIGPSIGPCCYEVDEDVKKQFDLSFDNDIIANVVKPSPTTDGKYYLDLKNTNRLMLLDIGVKDEHIEISSYCTKCRSEIFFSHRHMGSARGSQAGIIALK